MIVLLLITTAACNSSQPASEATSHEEPPAPEAPTPEPIDPTPAFERAAMVFDTARSVGFHQAEAERERLSALPPKNILMVGDSMAFFLGQSLKPMLEGEGHSFKSLHKASDSLRAWRWQGPQRLKTGLLRHKPDMVIVVMGTNDYWYPRIDRLLPTVQRTVAAIGDRPCYWIGPPMWRPDTGIIDLLNKHSTPCQFFDSKPLSIERKRDGIHPTEIGSQAWADAFYAWMKNNPPSHASLEPVKQQD